MKKEKKKKKRRRKRRKRKRKRKKKRRKRRKMKNPFPLFHCENRCEIVTQTVRLSIACLFVCFLNLCLFIYLQTFIYFTNMKINLANIH